MNIAEANTGRSIDTFPQHKLKYQLESDISPEYNPTLRFTVLYSRGEIERGREGGRFREGGEYWTCWFTEYQTCDSDDEWMNL